MRNPRLAPAFKALRKEGFFARQNFWCCQSCGCAAVPEDKAEAYVFYHAQDKDDLDRNGSCYLAFGGNGAKIVEILNANSIKTEWDGSENSRIKMICKEA